MTPVDKQKKKIAAAMMITIKGAKKSLTASEFFQTVLRITGDHHLTPEEICKECNLDPSDIFCDPIKHIEDA